jgi:nitroreductase
MDIYEALYTTRAMRRLRPDPIPLEVQARILDAAIRAPHIGEQWRFLLIDDPAIKTPLADLYRHAWARLFEQMDVNLADLLQSDAPHGRAARSGDHLARHFQDVPLLLVGFARNRDGSGIYPALWSAMLAARAEGIGSTLTAVLQSFVTEEVFDLLDVPKEAGWYLHGAIPMGYPTGKWGVGTRLPVHEVAARNSWQGELGFTVPEPLWPDHAAAFQGALPK